MKRLAPAAIGMALTIAVPVIEATEPGEPLSAKSLFEGTDSDFNARAIEEDVVYGPPDGAASVIRIRKSPTGLRYRIKLLENGDSLLVPNTRVFRSGEQIQLLLTSNVDAYLAILQIAEDSSMDLLYPDSDLGLVKNRVQAHREVVFPGPAHGFRFVDEPGTERLLVVLAQSKHQLDQLKLETRIASTEGTKLLDEAEKLAANRRQQVVEVARSDVATYAVNIGGGYVLQEIRLTHR
ncbi:MAG: DUF4384 domain-containing protein [bacterium]|nr:DUF4384 domain-containing protein [bacterium]